MAPPKRDAFPALPKAVKPTSTVFSPGYTGYGVRRVNQPAAGGSAWGPGSGLGDGGSLDDGSTAGPTDQDGKKALKGRKGKQVLFNWG